ncbi:multidrug transporter [Chelonobacter oris]|uniref:Multidrug transporter n=1 Tax=Chelonobacter oris TaxID=505317 RepID=A0A0A3ATD7_9PAST|nr:multidrug efflux SMR transporter [Chelonobacter oris]KGQ70355.1 multidrug transporter [Chelonobacter oris]
MRLSEEKTAWLYLCIAIVAEVIATSMLKLSNEFTRVVPSIMVIAGYGVAFYFLALTLRTMPIGIAYAIWSGIGIFLITAIGRIFYQQKLDWAAIIGITLIVSGVVVTNLFSKVMSHS